MNPELSKWALFLGENKLILKNITNNQRSQCELLSIARDYTQNILGINCPGEISDNVVTTGHQAVWHHCGVWSKNVIVHKFADSVGGLSLHIVLDHDISDTAVLLPKQNSDESWYFERNEIESKQNAIPLEFRPVPQNKKLKSFINKIIKYNNDQLCNDIWLNSSLFNKYDFPHLNNIADVVTYFQSMLNITLKLNILYMPVSQLCQSDVFFNFVVSIILDSHRFANCYNHSISTQFDLTKNNPIIRKLKIDEKENIIELPFWLVSADGRRLSLCVMLNRNNNIGIKTAFVALGNLDSSSLDGKSRQFKNILDSHNIRLRPKAVTLTLFIRLFLTDWFVHGVGGSRYEPITDYIIEKYYGMKPPTFGIVTSTMMLPVFKDLIFSSENISEIKHRLHDIKYNPEKHIDKSILEIESVSSLIKMKRGAVEHSKDRSLHGSIRKSAWNSISNINRKLSKYTKESIKILENKVAKLEMLRKSQEICNYRKYFFGLFPRKELDKLTNSLDFSKK